MNSNGVFGLIDDLLIYGKTKEEHQQRFVMVLRKLKREGVTLNKDKCRFYATKISFFRHIVNEPNLEKTRAIRNVPRPTIVSEMSRFLRMLNQLNMF